MSLNWRKVLWVLPLLLLACGVFLLFKNPRKFFKRELEVIDAEAEARTELANTNATIATARIETRFSRELGKLDDEQKKKASELRSDPVKLAAFLTRLSK